MKAIELEQPFFTIEQLSVEQQFNEHIMTRLRTKEGINLVELTSIFGEEKKNHLMSLSNSFFHEGRLMIQEDCMVLTEEGMLYADGIAASLFMD
jgi:oxygen-independent coproporphyrinogen-3 oxidase